MRHAEREWSNWSGSLRFAPRAIERPESEDELRELVTRAVEQGSTIRPVGAGHSSTGILETDDTLISLERLRGLQSHDGDVATLGPGTTVREAGDVLLEVGRAMENLGDVDYQTLAGGIGTGTHGTGKRYTNVSGQVVGGRMITGTGELVEFSGESDLELLRASVLPRGAKAREGATPAVRGLEGAVPDHRR